MELTREHCRSIIFYNFRCGLSRQECIDELKSLFGDKAPSYSAMKNLFNEFNCGRRSLKDELREDPPKTAVVSENIDAVRELIMQDVKMRAQRFSSPEHTVEVLKNHVLELSQSKWANKHK